jgi:hypothetical protein
MNQLVVNVIGSSGNPYAVSINTAEGHLSMLCPCQAGESGKFCKHLGQLLEGDLSAISDAAEKAAFKNLMASDEAQKTIQQYEVLRAALESQLKAEALAKKAASNIKKEIFSLISPKDVD